MCFEEKLVYQTEPLEVIVLSQDKRGKRKKIYIYKKTLTCASQAMEDGQTQREIERERGGRQRERERESDSEDFNKFM